MLNKTFCGKCSDSTVDIIHEIISSIVGWVVETVITLSILITSILFPDVYNQIAGSLTILFLIIGIFAIYSFFFCEEKKSSYGYLLCNALLSMTFANRLYIYSNLVSVFPFIQKAENGVFVVAVMVGSGLLFAFAQMLNHAKKAESNEKEQASGKSVPIEKNSTENPVSGNLSTTDTSVNDEQQKTDDKDNTSSSKINTGTFYYIVSVIIMFLIIVAVSVFLIFRFSDISSVDIKTNPIDNTTVIIMYGIVFLMVVFIVVFGFLVLLTFSSYLIQKILEFVNRIRQKPGSGNAEHDIPLYVLSVFVVLALFYLSYKFGNFTVEDFTEFAVNGKYLAYPLLLILIISVFILLLWIVHLMLALLSTINGKSLKDRIRKVEHDSCLIENCTQIIKAVFHYVFTTILSILSFLSFIPVYFISMASLAGVSIYQIIEKKEKKEEDLEDTTVQKQEKQDERTPG